MLHRDNPWNSFERARHLRRNGKFARQFHFDFAVVLVEHEDDRDFALAARLEDKRRRRRIII